jgi:Skp family chaperone for outer membrane proteins
VKEKYTKMEDEVTNKVKELNRERQRKDRGKRRRCEEIDERNEEKIK